MVCSFIAYFGYYRIFIEFFSKIAFPFFQLLSKDVEFVWTNACEEAFSRIKKLISEAPILRAPDWKLAFHISPYASHRIVGVVLGQQEDKNPYAIYYVIKNLTPAELNYTVIEKEILVVIYVK